MSDQRKIRRIGSLVNQLMSRRGYAQALAGEEIHRVIAKVIDTQISTAFQVGNLNNGVLRVYVNDSVTLQEMNFQKRAILKKLQQELPQQPVTDLRFRIQS